MIESPRDNQNKIRDPERLDEIYISVFGAQGHLGSSLMSRLDAIKPAGVEVEPVVRREDNEEAAFHSNLVILTVRPAQVTNTLEWIRNSLNPDSQILSFAAGIPLADVVAASGHPSARMMADPWWNISAFVRGEHFSQEGNEFIFDRLTQIRPIELKDDASLDRFTVLLGQLFVALLLERSGQLRSALPHIEFIAAQEEFNQDPAVLARFETGPDAEEALRTIVTRGGISEKIWDRIMEKPDIKPADLFSEVSAIRQRRK